MLRQAVAQLDDIQTQWQVRHSVFIEIVSIYHSVWVQALPRERKQEQKYVDILVDSTELCLLAAETVYIHLQTFFKFFVRFRKHHTGCIIHTFMDFLILDSPFFIRNLVARSHELLTSDLSICNLSFSSVPPISKRMPTTLSSCFSLRMRSHRLLKVSTCKLVM